jgi:hypothetical protein
MSENEANYLAKGDGKLGSCAESVEQQIQRLGATTAPRITPADVEANIASEHYFSAADGVCGAASEADREQFGATMPEPLQLLTICILVLRNGFTVLGISSCASPANYNQEVGERIARENAVRNVWPLMGYALREQLHAITELEREFGQSRMDER